VRTLRHAIERGKVHHAYLFVGSRGTGKTSMAKILAACLNCERGPTTEPCGECESCVSIAGASSLDVIEMDAASNNSVDDIRELRESVAYAPVSGRRKVYILDEAHMLSTAAWNAFLKTLEEPPPNTVFVLATTEAQKVPATVVDRCHRFDFHRPSVEQIASVLRRTAEAESIDIPPAALAALARSATGSFRDALGTLEQLVTYSGKEIALADVLAVLGVADGRLLEETIDAVAVGDARRALTALEECVEQGRDAASFASDLEVRARELLVVATLGEVPGELSLTPEADAALRAQAERVAQETVVRLLELLGEAMEGVRAGADPRTRLELSLVKAARPDFDSSTRALQARIARLEAERGVLSAVAPERDVPAEQRPETTAGPSKAPATATPADQSPPGGGAAPDRAADAEPSSGAASLATVAERPSDAASERATVADPPTAVQSSDAEDIAPLLAWWPSVVEAVRAENAMLGACIDEARPVEVKGEDLVVAFSASTPFHKKKAESPENRAAVAAALRDVTGQRWRLSYELHDGIPPRGGDEPAPSSEEEWVRRFMEEFDAEELPQQGSAPAAGAAPVGDNGAERAGDEQERA